LNSAKIPQARSGTGISGILDCDCDRRILDHGMPHRPNENAKKCVRELWNSRADASGTWGWSGRGSVGPGYEKKKRANNRERARNKTRRGCKKKVVQTRFSRPFGGRSLVESMCNRSTACSGRIRVSRGSKTQGVEEAE
jgi:hypothetical protein